MLLLMRHVSHIVLKLIVAIAIRWGLASIHIKVAHVCIIGTWMGSSLIIATIIAMTISRIGGGGGGCSSCSYCSTA
ncbi:hypothetical protein BGW37DRAFT_500942 [Umbelopsis sp. PMI_123]|nr:hypothetical protein BGW37DRAFT_500942 [Umbelopsis sp. PMI_123]